MPACPHSRHTWSQKSEISLSMTTPLPETPGNHLLFLPFQFQLLAFPGFGTVSLCPVFKVSSLLSQIHLCLSPGRILVIGLKVHLTNPGWCRHFKVTIFAKVLRIRVWAVFTASSQCVAPVINSEAYQGPLSLSEEKEKIRGLSIR